MKWTVNFLPEAVNDLEAIDNSIRKQIIKVLLPKLESNPHEYGTLLGNRLGIKLSGLYKITPVSGYRVVYRISDQEVFVCVIAIGKREREGVYKSAAERIRGYIDGTRKELDKLNSLNKK